jgi:hypothetical protein
MVRLPPRPFSSEGYRPNTSVSSRFIKTKLISDTAVTHLNKAGMQFAEVDDAGQAALRAIADRSVNGAAI